MDKLLAVDKPYGVTAEGKLVDPKHPLCRQIIAHHTGQQVPAVLLKRAGLTDEKGENFKARDYDKVEIPAEYKPGGGAAAASAAGPSAEDFDKAVAAEVKKQLASVLPKAVAEALKQAQTPSQSGGAAGN